MRKRMEPGTVFDINILGEPMRATVISDNGYDVDVISHAPDGDSAEVWPEQYVYGCTIVK